eukprot:scaffold51512_cov56-Attheya_sp.AAC.2
MRGYGWGGVIMPKARAEGGRSEVEMEKPRERRYPIYGIYWVDDWRKGWVQGTISIVVWGKSGCGQKEERVKWDGVMDGVKGKRACLGGVEVGEGDHGKKEGEEK